MKTNIIYVITFFLCLICCGDILGQGYSSVLEHPDRQSWAWCMEPHPDGGAVIASVIGCPDVWGHNQIILFKTDVKGDLEYYKPFAFCDSISTELQIDGPLLQVDSSFYMFWFPFDTNDQIYLTKFDLDLNEVFTRTYQTDGVMIASHVVQISPDRLVLNYGEFKPEEKGIERFIKVDLEGMEISRGQVSFPHWRYKARGVRFTRSVYLTETGTLLMSFATAESSWAHNHYMLEVDTLFNVVGDYHYENLEDFDTQHCGSNGYIVQSSAPLPDGNFVVVNCRDTIEFAWPPIMLDRYHPRITAYTPNGQKVWDTTFLSYGGYEVNQIVTDDEGFIYCVGEVDRTERTNDISGAFFLKMTAQGEVVWLRKIYPDHTKFGDSNGMLNVEALPDGGLLAAGRIDMNDEQGSLNNWLIRLDSNGCLTPGCNGEDILLSTSDDDGIWRSLDQVPFLVYPNPTSGQIMFQTDFVPDSDDVIIWYDQMGRAVQTHSLLREKFQVLRTPTRSGLYFLTLFKNGVAAHSEKVRVD